MQRRHIGSKTAFGFDLQKAGHVGFRQVGHLRMGRERPFQRQAYNAMALADAGGVQMVANLAPDQLRVGGQRIE